MRGIRLDVSHGLALALLVGACEAAPYDMLDADVGDPDGPDALDGDIPDTDGADDAEAADHPESTDTPADETDAPQPDPTLPCGTIPCWDADPSIQGCDTRSVRENFSSGRYNAHRYRKLLYAGSQARFELLFLSGTESPAIVLTTRDGRVLSDGAIASPDGNPEVQVLDDGRVGSLAVVTVAAAVNTDLDLYVTSWSVVDGGFVPPMPTDVQYELTAETDCGSLPPGAGIAPPGTMTGELDAESTGTVSVDGSWGPPYRVDARPAEHVTFRLDFTPTTADLRWELYRFDGREALLLAHNNSADLQEWEGFRVAAVLDPDASRTFWIRFRREGGSSASGTLRIDRVPFTDGETCTDDCDRLLVLPQPNDSTDGYGVPGHTIYPFQYGRRDILMAIRHAGRVMSAEGSAWFTVKDLSRWDGLVWPDHDTHEAGLHADLSIINQAGEPVWASFCDVSGNECIPGTISDFGARHMARLINALFDCGKLIWVLLDREFHGPLLDAVDELIAEGVIDPDRRPYFDATSLLCDGRPCVRHVAYHHHHMHIKVAP